MRRRTHTNAVIHLRGTPGSPGAVARVSGHLVLEQVAQLAQWPAQNFAGARVELAPGMTVYALDVCKLYRLGPEGWVEIERGPATPELEPPRPPGPVRPVAPRRVTAGRARPAPGVTLHDATALLRAISGLR